MGALTSRQNAGVEEADINSSHAYKYPPKSGSYFGSHFIMGGERFEATQPEAYLFGENSDLNFLGSRPSPFPYPAPQPNEPTKTLRSLINIRKESLKFLRVVDPVVAESRLDGEGTVSPQMIPLCTNSQYNIEFTFDCDVRCAIAIHYFCNEEITSNGAAYVPKDPTLSSETYHYKRGANQQFSQATHTFSPCNFAEDELNYYPDSDSLPIVIQCVAEEGDDPKQSHITIAFVEKTLEDSYVIKPLKQKQFVDGLCYLLQEIYGIENKNAERQKNSSDDEVDDNGSECVICMSDIRNTLILPCRHLCLCNSCADSLRYQANNCPICRSPFRALLQVQALRKLTSSTNNMLPGSIGAGGQQQNSESQDISVPQGYESISLLEALNGTSQIIAVVPTVTANCETVRDSPVITKRPLFSRMLSGSNASLQGGRKNLATHMKTNSVSLSEPNVTNVGRDKLTTVVPIDFEDAKQPDTNAGTKMSIAAELRSSHGGSVKSATLPRCTDTVQIVDEVAKNQNTETKNEKKRAKEDRLVDGADEKMCGNVSDSNDKVDGDERCAKLNVAAASLTTIDDDSDYYTPEDPTSDDIVDDDGEESKNSIKLNRLSSVTKKDQRTDAIGCKSSPQSSKRSSTDSFSSTSSATRLLTITSNVPMPDNVVTANEETV